jgi:hypothetical protein
MPTYRKQGFLKTRLSVKSMSEYGRFLLPGMVAALVARCKGRMCSVLLHKFCGQVLWRVVGKDPSWTLAHDLESFSVATFCREKQGREDAMGKRVHAQSRAV